MSINEFADLINGKVWSKNGKLRIYFKTEKTSTAYIDYEEGIYTDMMEGGVLKVFSNCYNQTTKWNVNRSKQIKHEIMLLISQITGDKVCEKWQDVIL